MSAPGLSEIADLACADVIEGRAPEVLGASVEARAARIVMDLIGCSVRVAIDATRAAARRAGLIDASEAA